MNETEQRQQDLDQLYEQVMEQAQTINQMKHTIAQLVGEVRALSQRDTTYVEKIEYKFDQLKVETVEGTLHIGVLPGQNKSDQLFSEAETGVSGGPYDLQFSSQAQTAVYDAAKRRIDYYINTDLLNYIKQLEDDYACVLGEHYRTQIVQDIRAQMDGRLLYYLNQMNLTQDEQAATDEVVRRTTRDIEDALNEHIAGKKEQGA